MAECLSSVFIRQCFPLQCLVVQSFRIATKQPGRSVVVSSWFFSFSEYSEYSVVSLFCSPTRCGPVNNL